MDYNICEISSELCDPGFKFLTDFKTKKQVPLYHLNTDIKVENNIAEITFEQFYLNNSDEPIETEYIFPAHKDAILGKLEMKYKDKLIKAVVEEREAAQAKYEDAVASGKTAVMSTFVKKDKDLMRFLLGGVPPKSEIVLVCKFYQQLAVDDLSWLLHVPAKIIPKYMGDPLKFINTGHNLSGTHGSQVDDEEKGVLIEDIKEAHRVYYQKKEFTWSLNMNINSSSAFQRIVSTTHKIDVKFLDEDMKIVQINLADQSEETMFNSDFKLLFRNSDINKPMVLAQKLNNEYAVMVSFLADVSPEDEAEQRVKDLQDSVDMNSDCVYKNSKNSMKPGEFYFVLDRSGSMYGSTIETAKKALMLFIRSIPPGSRFNIISFGSTFQGMFSEPAEYTQDTLEYAIDQVKGFDADFGGTEIYQPLENIFSRATTSTDLDKHVYLITDGAVFNPQDVVNLIRSYNDDFNVHTFGIGNGASTTLVIECANAGNGRYYFVNDKAEGLQGKVIDALSKSFEPYVKFDNNEIFIEGNKYLEMPEAKSIKNKVFNGDYFTYCAIVNELTVDKL
jgi:von Willebrand factor A domain-containing protein 5